MTKALHNHQRTINSQNGAVLIVSLLILMVLTLISLSSLQTSTLDEKMTANMRDKQTAFEAAEYALRQAEDFLSPANLTSSAIFNGTNGLYGINDVEPDYTLAATWSTTGTQSRQVATPLSGVRTQPRFFAAVFSIQKSTTGSKNIGGYANNATGTDTTYIRITARGTGISDNSQVILREIYARKF